MPSANCARTKSAQQPAEQTGGQRAMQTSSPEPYYALRQSVFRHRLPVDGDELKRYARPNASEREKRILEQFGGHTYHSMFTSPGSWKG